MGVSERLPVLRVVMEQKMAFPEKSPWELSHCGKSYKSLNPVTAPKILVLRSEVKVAKKKKKKKKKCGCSNGHFSQIYTITSERVRREEFYIT